MNTSTSNGRRTPGVAAPSLIFLTPIDGQTSSIANADAGSVLQLTFPGLDPSHGVTFSTTGGVSHEIGPNSVSVTPGVNYSGIYSQPVELALDGNPGTLSVTWWVVQPNQFISLVQSATVTIPGTSAPLQFPGGFHPPYPNFPVPAPGRPPTGIPSPLPSPGPRVPAPPTGVPSPVRSPVPLPPGAPAPAAATTGVSGTTIGLIVAGVAVAVAGGYLIYRRSKRPARAAPRRR